ncbi:O-linked N-acetylglucosamine transferase family protein [Azospirillum fermentarium]|uniref:O-linked N-acetylglucosamine transferase family protein n=1 Tax=Azospirillum fermentarium TaxID=1233114 RepID=UPI003873B01B
MPIGGMWSGWSGWSISCATARWGRRPIRCPPPVLERGTVSFGSFNALSKLNGATAALWSRVLHAVPGSRLVLKAAVLADPAVKARVLTLFAGHGIDGARIALLPHIPNHFGHLDAYGAIDIALDPIPYNGTTTTCEALWMGVPVLTLPGEAHAARVGASLLTAAGLPEWIADDADGFAAKAAALAADPQGLAAIRAGLRARLQASFLCDGRTFARRFEDRCFTLSNAHPPEGAFLPPG